MINEFGITLIPLSYEDIELVREWRNSDKIKQFARNQDFITKEKQENWFLKLDKDKSLYFIIIIDNIKIGLIWANYLNENEVETGFYIYEDKYLNSIYSYKIVTAIHNYLFLIKKVKNIYCDILDNNKRAIRFNISLGFEKISQENNFSRYILTFKTYEISLQKIKPIILKY